MSCIYSHNNLSPTRPFIIFINSKCHFVNCMPPITQHLQGRTSFTDPTTTLEFCIECICFANQLPRAASKIPGAHDPGPHRAGPKYWHPSTRPRDPLCKLILKHVISYLQNVSSGEMLPHNFGTRPNGYQPISSRQVQG